MVKTPIIRVPGRHSSLSELFRWMVRIRLFEEEVMRLRTNNEIVGSVHLCIGQEAIPVGSCAALQDQDVVFATYRGHGWAIGCGVPLRPMFAELLGKRAGLNAGRGGSAYFSAPDYGFYGENSIVGAGAPIAVGSALAAQFDGSDRVVVCAFGDGAMNQGAVHEAFNFAVITEAPVVFVVENNGYSELTPIADMVHSDRLFRRASAYGMPAARLNGNDVVKVRATMIEAIDSARRGGGPVLIEMTTQRLVGHYIGDAQQYRSADEIEIARREEPLVVARAALAGAGWTPEQISAVEAEVAREVETASSEALTEPDADPDTARRHVYA